MKFILFAVFLYFAYKFIFNFVIPIFNTTRKLRDQVKNMTERMQQQNASNNVDDQKPDTGQKPKSGDYIEFEEVKG